MQGVWRACITDASRIKWVFKRVYVNEPFSELHLYILVWNSQTQCHCHAEGNQSHNYIYNTQDHQQTENILALIRSPAMKDQQQKHIQNHSSHFFPPPKKLLSDGSKCLPKKVLNLLKTPQSTFLEGIWSPRVILHLPNPVTCTLLSDRGDRVHGSTLLAVLGLLHSLELAQVRRIVILKGLGFAWDA